MTLHHHFSRYLSLCPISETADSPTGHGRCSVAVASQASPFTTPARSPGPQSSSSSPSDSDFLSPSYLFNIINPSHQLVSQLEADHLLSAFPSGRVPIHPTPAVLITAALIGIAFSLNLS